MIDIKKQRKALCIINSWLKSKKINCAPESGASDPRDYRLKLTANHSRLEGNTFYININEILSRDNLKAQKALNIIVKKLINKEETFVRVSKTPIAYYQDDYEGVYLRHTDFNRAPNLSNEEISKYSDVVGSEARKTLNKFSRMATQAGFEYSDLYNIGLVYLISFLHEHQRETLTETRKILRVCLKQRFNHWAKTTMKKHRNAMSAGMFLSEAENENFKNEVLFQDEMRLRDNEINLPEYEKQSFKIHFNNIPTTLTIDPSWGEPKFYVGTQEYDRATLVEMISNKKIKPR